MPVLGWEHCSPPDRKRIAFIANVIWDGGYSNEPGSMGFAGKDEKDRVFIGFARPYIAYLKWKMADK